MSCEHAKELADVAAGGAAGPALEAHLAACAECRSELAELQAALAVADEALGVLAHAEPSPALRARIREATAAATSAPGWRWLWATAAVAGLGVIAFTAWLVASRAGSPPGTTARTVRPGGTASAAPETRQTAGASGLQTGTSGSHLPGLRGSGASGAATEPARVAVTEHPADRARLRRPAEPEVLVPPGEEQALLRLVAIVHQTNAVPAGLAAAGEPPRELTRPRDIEVEPLEIAPLDPAEGDGD